MARGPSSETDEHGADDQPSSSQRPVRKTASRTSSSGQRDDRGLLRGLLNLLLVVLLLAGILIGAVMLSPMSLEEVKDIDSLDDLDDVIIDTGPLPDPSSEPPPAGERTPDVTDPGDPGDSTYETEVETVSSATVEDFVHAEVNDRRADHGLEALEWDGTVASVSRAHSVDMAQRDYFAHVNPDDEGPYDRFEDVDSYCRAYGENIALTWVDRPIEEPGGDETIQYQTAERLATGLVDQWMNSTSHREAILEEHGGPGWDRGGVGVYIADDGSVYASHNFCRAW
ncbi:CAP domain-containing protein [Natronolimnobius baerhuensis]|uniref:Serine protease n=1 Tax=Natronolimnobius baerhuensis TaxID=253108 RepID=A0A202E4L1_9EURY|nr:CAP domain-containing protein [Natronolimnobius baerhuensis]OVE83225.1 serine protease [Natronolimnobius baerhuensis]